MKDSVGNDSVGAYEAKAHLSELLDRAGRGEEITITRHGSPVAKLVPATVKATPAERRAAIERWLKVASGLSLKGLTVRDLIDEGRV